MTITFNPNSHYATLVSNIKALWLLLTAKYVKVMILEETFVENEYNGYNKLIGFGGIMYKKIKGKWIRKSGAYLVFGEIKNNEIWVGYYERVNYKKQLPPTPYILKVGESAVLKVHRWSILPILPHISNRTYNQTIKIQLDAHPN